MPETGPGETGRQQREEGGTEGLTCEIVGGLGGGWVCSGAPLREMERVYAGTHYIVDVNYLPSYAHVPGAAAALSLLVHHAIATAPS